MLPLSERDAATADALISAGLSSVEQLSIIYFDRDMRILAVHGGAGARHGYLPERVIGRCAPDVLPASAWETIGPLYTRALTGETVTLDLTSADGSAIYETTFQPVYADGVLIGGMATSRDVTRERRAEDGLAETARQLQVLADTSLEGHCRYSPDGVLLWASAAMEKITGHSVEALVGLQVQTVIHEDDMDRRNESFAMMVQTQQPHTIELRARHADGSWRFIESTVRGVFTEDGELTEVYTTSRDTTDRRAADDLRRQWQLTFESTMRGITITNAETGLIEQANPAFAAMHGGVPEDFAGRAMATVLAPNCQMHADTVKQDVRRLGVAHVESEHVRLDGTVFPVNMEIVAAGDDARQVQYRVAFHDDMTETHARRAAERRAIARFERSFDEAPVGMMMLRDGRIERANEALGRMLGVPSRHLPGIDPMEFADPAEIEDLRAALEAVTAGRAQPARDRRIVTRDGRVLRVRLRYSALREEDGSSLVLVHCIDRTAEFAAEAERERALRLFEQSFSRAPIGMCLVATDGRFLRVNDALCELFGRARAELLAADFQQLTHPEDLEADLALLGETLDGARDGYEIDKRYMRPDGSVIEARLSVQLIRDTAGKPEHFISQIVDLTALKRARGELANANSLLQGILDNSPTAIYVRDLDERWLVANAEICRMTGTDPGDLIGCRLEDTYPPDAVAVLREHDAAVLAAGAGLVFDVELPQAAGDPRHWWTMKFPVLDDDGELIGLGGISLDVTEREEAVRELGAARAVFEAAFQNAPIGKLISRRDPDGAPIIIKANRAFAAMLGVEISDLVGANALELMNREDLPRRDQMLAELAAGENPVGEVRFKHADGHDVWTQIAPAKVESEDGQPIFLLQAIDITERRAMEAQLQHLADHDGLTGILGRRRFDEELERELARTRRHADSACLLLLDLDGFKAVNDTFGHAVGDELLQRVARTAKDKLRAEDIVARLGGDEFAVILPSTDVDGAQTVAQQLAAAIRAAGRVNVDGREVQVTASIGVAEISAEGDAEKALAEADLAMYEAKRSGRDSVIAFRDALRAT